MRPKSASQLSFSLEMPFFCNAMFADKRILTNNDGHLEFFCDELPKIHA